MVTNPRKASLLVHLAECVLTLSARDVLFRDEFGTHINPFYLVDDDPIRQTVVELITDEIYFEKIQNLVGFMDSGYLLASIIASKFELPLYSYSFQKKGFIPKETVIRWNEKGNNCALIIGFTSSKEKITEAISRIENRGGSVVQIISLIDEELGVKVAMEKKGISFISLLTLSEIKDIISSKIVELKNRIDFIEKNL